MNNNFKENNMNEIVEMKPGAWYNVCNEGGDEELLIWRAVQFTEFTTCGRFVDAETRCWDMFRIAKGQYIEDDQPIMSFVK